VTRRLVLLLGAALAAALAQPAGLIPLDEAGFQKLIASGKGRVLLVDFWATYCVPCRAEMPQLVALEGRYQSRGLKLIAISADEPEQEAGALEFLRKQRVRCRATSSGRATTTSSSTPSIQNGAANCRPCFLYDRQGAKVKSFFGETDLAALEAALRKLL